MDRAERERAKKHSDKGKGEKGKGETIQGELGKGETGKGEKGRPRVVPPQQLKCSPPHSVPNADLRTNGPARSTDSASAHLSRQQL